MNAVMQTEKHQRSGLSQLGLDSADARVLVMGLGLTGLSLVRFLSEKGVQLCVVDSRETPPYLEEVKAEFPQVVVHTGSYDTGLFDVATHLIVSPGIGLDEDKVQQALKKGVPVLGDIDVFAVCADADIACITGSNGKSTVTTLLGEMATQAGWDVRVGGNLGVPALNLLSSVEPDLYVLELSSFQLERTSELKASAAAVLNISDDHMDRYENMGAYIQAKKRIFHGEGLVVYNRHDSQVTALVPAGRESTSFGLDAPVGDDYGLLKSDKETYLGRNNKGLISTVDLKICGSHNIENALAAMALADGLSMPKLAQKHALATFEGLEHRMQWVAERDDVTWINDSKATNVGACLAALNGLNAPLILIVGGDGKGADFSELSDVIKEKVSTLVLMGKDAAKLEQQVGTDARCLTAESIEQAVQMAEEKAVAGDTVLLSPACASLDQFKNYQERGNRFMKAVQS